MSYLSDRRYQEAAKKLLNPDHYNFPPIIDIEVDSGTVYRDRDKYGLPYAMVQAWIRVSASDAREVTYRPDGVDDDPQEEDNHMRQLARDLQTQLRTNSARLRACVEQGTNEERRLVTDMIAAIAYAAVPYWKQLGGVPYETQRGGAPDGTD